MLVFNNKILTSIIVTLALAIGNPFAVIAKTQEAEVVKAEAPEKAEAENENENESEAKDRGKKEDEGEDEGEDENEGEDEAMGSSTSNSELAVKAGIAFPEELPTGEELNAIVPSYGTPAPPQPAPAPEKEQPWYKIW